MTDTLTAHELLLRRLSCDLANDAACLLRGDLTPDVVAHRLMGYSEDIVKSLDGFDGPATLKQYLHAGGSEDIERTRRTSL